VAFQLSAKIQRTRKNTSRSSRIAHKTNDYCRIALSNKLMPSVQYMDIIVSLSCILYLQIPIIAYQPTKRQGITNNPMHHSQSLDYSFQIGSQTGAFHPDLTLLRHRGLCPAEYQA
jgi:hypothetical protein